MRQKPTLIFEQFRLQTQTTHQNDLQLWIEIYEQQRYEREKKHLTTHIETVINDEIIIDFRVNEKLQTLLTNALMLHDTDQTIHIQIQNL